MQYIIKTPHVTSELMQKWIILIRTFAMNIKCFRRAIIICAILLFSGFASNAQPSNCIQYEPESIDSNSYHYSLSEKQRLSAKVFAIQDSGKSIRQKCDSLEWKSDYDSCMSNLSPLKIALKLYIDSTQVARRFGRLYVNQRIPDTACYTFDSTKPFSITYSESGMGKIYYVIDLGVDSIVTHIKEVDSSDGFPATFRLLKYPLIRAKVNNANLGRVIQAIRESHIVDFMSHYANTNIHDGVQAHFQVRQSGWVKSVRLSNYSPQEVRMLKSVLDSLVIGEPVINQNSPAELNKYNIAINGWDFLKPRSISRPKRTSKLPPTKPVPKKNSPCSD